VSILPNVPFHQPALPPPEDPESRVLLVVGSWTHRVNVEGVDRFLAGAWPRIRERIPDVHLRLVGSGMSQELRSRWSRTGVTPVGRIEDLSEEYARAALCLAPLYEGGGSKIKVLEALAHRRTCVVTGHALRGYSHLLKPGESVLVGDDDGSFAAACVAQLAQPAQRAAMAEQGHAIVRAHFSRTVFTLAVREAVDRVLSARQTG
jgi:glycosyltransferase involved in cell wall biosynthesis